jgi:hypothetical protein
MIIKLIKCLIESEHDRQSRLADQWLADSESLQEIEHKQRMIDRGQAPWQLRANHKLKGWT